MTHVPHLIHPHRANPSPPNFFLMNLFSMIKPMTNLRICLALTLIPMTAIEAQTLVSPSLQDPRPAEPVKHHPKVLKITAAAEPDPALRYRFWPAPEKRTNENPSPFVSRAVMLAIQAMNDPAARTEFAQRYDEWSEMPLNELPVDQLRDFVNKFGGRALGELARAENHLRIDYDLQLGELSPAEMVQTLLPEFQEMRQLARLLQLRARLAVAEQRWDDAVEDLRIGFRLADVAGHSTDFLIGRLVGFAISSVMMHVVMEAIEQPGCPNLYWALASLPEHRLFETRDSIEFESVLISRLINPLLPSSNHLAPLPDHPIGADAARVRIQELAEQAYATLMPGDASDVTAKMMSGIYVVTMVDESRELLANTTPWGERATELSAPEAVLRATLVKFARIRDGWVKWSLLPPEVWSEYKAETSAAVDQQSKRDILVSLVNMMTPAVDAARRAGQRTLQTRNLLISIEAIRMHAADAGELPKTINALRPVPCWNDGIALAPFGYQRTSATTATLTREERWPGDPETVFHLELIQGNH